MLKTIKNDLDDASDCLEHIKATLPRLTREERVDLCARIGALCKTAKLIDEEIKKDIKIWRKGKIGYVLGESFKAFLNVFPVTRLDQKKVEVDYPKVYHACLTTNEECRVTFEAR